MNTYNLKTKIKWTKSLWFKIQYHFIWKFISDQVIEEYAIDSELLDDYYNERENW